MAMFKKPEPAQPTDNGNGKPGKSKWQGVIDHMTEAERHMSEAMNLMSMINFDLQKGADFIAHYRESLTRTIIDAGGEIDPGSVEEQIRDYIPKAIQRDRVVDETN